MQNAKLMVCGTMSSAGKSLLVAGLCRILRQDGWSVAPFKSQNMALNSYVTDEGLEMGRAQALQAQAAGERPVAAMNPILLKPTGEHASQVILNGEVAANSMSAREYFAVKTQYIPLIRRAYDTLAGTHDAVVIEGAGSPAEINLKDNDIVNMGLARMLDAPVLLVADIDRGGVFAQLYGTVKLLSEEEQERIVGMVINKFRGDPTLLEPGITQIEGLLGIPVVGTVPYIEDLYLPDEDSLSQRFTPKPKKTADGHDRIRLAVIRYPRISNFTDMDAFDQCENVEVVFVRSDESLEKYTELVVMDTYSSEAFPNISTYLFYNITDGLIDYFEYQIDGANLIWQGDDLSTAVYQQYNDIYDIWGRPIGHIQEGELYELSF